MNEKNMTFEQNMKRLEEIVRAMERGDIALEESLNMFQEGTELITNCTKLLDEAELQVRKVLAQANGSPAEEEFPHDGF